MSTKMFGMSGEQIEKEFQNSLLFFDKASGPDRLMYAMGILSDVQELIERDSHDDLEVARQWINKAKYHISKVMEESRAST